MPESRLLHANRVLAIADDLTGSLEAGAKFAQSGLPAVVTTKLGDEVDSPVLVIDTESRHTSAAEAERIVATACEGRHAALIYKKTDSTLRGNIAAELRALSRCFPGRIAYVAAYPALGRTVRNGSVFVNGVPLAESSFAGDALNPVHDGRVRSRLDPDSDCVIFDGETDADIDAAAAAILDTGDFRIVAGPAAIAESLARRLGQKSNITWPEIATCLVVNGSRTAVSEQQIETARSAGALTGGWQLFERAIAANADPLAVALETGRALCDCLRSPDGLRGRDGVIVFGGDTAFGLLQSMGQPRVRPLGEILPGIPVSTVEGRPEFLITKAGGYGPPDLLLRLKKELNGER